MKNSTLKVDAIVEHYDFALGGLKFGGFKKVSTWEGFVKFQDSIGQQIIAFQGEENIFTSLLRLPGHSPPELALVTASKSILEQIEEQRATLDKKEED